VSFIIAGMLLVLILIVNHIDARPSYRKRRPGARHSPTWERINR